jgi:hypothetical protein
MCDFRDAYDNIIKSLEPKRIIVDCPKRMLNERTIKRIGKYQIEKDPPHTGGDEYHAHCKLGGYEVCWTPSGKRRHPNKFPADNKIPYNVKKAIADILGIKPEILECYQTIDESEENMYLITIRDEVQAKGRRFPNMQ